MGSAATKPGSRSDAFRTARPAVIGDFRKLVRLIRCCESLERRVGEGDNLAVIADLIHRPEARIEIMDVADGFHALGDAKVRAQLLDRRGDRRRQNMGVDVENMPSPSSMGPPV